MGLLEGQLPSYNTELTFIGSYGTMVRMCSEPEIPGGGLTVGQSVTGNSPLEVSVYAATLKKKHLDLHLKAGTEPCSADADPILAIYKNKAGRAVWIPVHNLISASPLFKPNL